MNRRVVELRRHGAHCDVIVRFVVWWRKCTPDKNALFSLDDRWSHIQYQATQLFSIKKSLYFNECSAVGISEKGSNPVRTEDF